MITTIRDQIAPAICEVFHPGANHLAPLTCSKATTAAAAVLGVFRDSKVRAGLVDDIASWLGYLDQAWDAPSDKTTPEWQRERSETAVTVLLTALGHGTPTMRGEYCGVELPDGSRCMYGRHHKIRKHRSDTGQELATEAQTELDQQG